MVMNTRTAYILCKFFKERILQKLYWKILWIKKIFRLTKRGHLLLPLKTSYNIQTRNVPSPRAKSYTRVIHFHTFLYLDGSRLLLSNRCWHRGVKSWVSGLLFLLILKGVPLLSLDHTHGRGHQQPRWFHPTVAHAIVVGGGRGGVGVGGHGREVGRNGDADLGEGEGWCSGGHGGDRAAGTGVVWGRVVIANGLQVVHTGCYTLGAQDVTAKK